MTWRVSLWTAGAGLLLVGLFIFARVEGAFIPWFLLYFYCIVLLYEAGTWFFNLRGITVRRRISATRLSAGQSVTVRVRVFREGWWPTLWLRVTEDLPRQWVFHAEDSQRVIQPLWTRELELNYRIHALKRGAYRIGSTELESGDVFGLQQRKKHFSGSSEVIVYPKVVPVRGWAGSRPDDTGSRQPTSHISEESTNVMGVRDYVPGDKLSRIHWMASARSGTLLSKEFELHVSSELVFMPDLSSISHKEHNDDVLELEMVVAASLIKFSFETHRRFGLTLHGKSLQQYPVGTSEALFLHCMEALAIAAADGEIPFSESLVRAAQDLPRGTTLVVVSPSLDKQSAIAVETISRKVSVEWFVPLPQGSVENADKHVLSMLQTAGAKVHLISSGEQLSQLGRGGTRFAVRA
ncbi:DUF58 domain-containing protein [Alicyclobacillus sp. SO9]|uniref:DUF58 domain-containing protein n=1 Tax=Alicyclobacillus sp. SO9 TaxID=2665646 RepID=UPI0018E70C75|nr:DUF58 domain-containing protein [Alicyclobacillus sp. SO9]QQE78589.1 DUF58 domain-containing protein [Alicyclobacillus sp. SO9]